MIVKLLNEGFREEILNLCERVAGSSVVAVCLFGPRILGYGDEKTNLEVLSIIKSRSVTLRFHREEMECGDVSLLVVDQNSFERDADEEWLGGLIVENIITPYKPLLNEEYLFRQEVRAKRRIILELIDNLILERPEMSSELLIKPEYFLFKNMMRKASLFPPITYRFLNMLRGGLREKNIKAMMRGFDEALRRLVEEGILEWTDGYLRLREEYIKKVRERRIQITSILKSLRRRILRYVFRAFPRMMKSFIRDREMYMDFSITGQEVLEPPIYKLEDPERHLFIHTPHGLVSLSDGMAVRGFIEKILTEHVHEPYVFGPHVKRYGGILNTVYLFRFKGREGLQRIIIKIFADLYGLKWFPIALWTLGTRDFSVLGRSRLEREYAINRFLSSKGIHVPRIIFVSPKERILLEEFIDGMSLDGLIKRSLTMAIEGGGESILRRVGKEIAKVHNLGVALGDCKPENIIITRNGEIYFLDLEQAARDGDQAWDIAEFLYYSGHYVSPLSMREARDMVREFVGGYLDGGGNPKNIEKAASARYMRIFIFFTPPHIILAISNTCKEILKSRGL